MRPMVHTEKHLIQFSQFAVASGSLQTKFLVSAVAAPNSSAEVREGSTISACYVEMWIQTDDATLGASIVTLEKLPGGVGTMNTADSAALNDYDNKKNIFYTQMGLTPNSTQFPMATIKGWYKIPKGKQRFGLADKLVLNIHAQSNGLSGCGFAVFKEQF